MICKNCGFEYLDGLKECPNCQTPNIPEEPKVMTQEERDTFGGVTIESTPVTQDGEEAGYKVYDSEEERARQEEEEAMARNRSYGFRVHTFGGVGLLWQVLILLVIIGFLFLVIPSLFIFGIVAAICYYLYAWLF